MAAANLIGRLEKYSIQGSDENFQLKDTTNRVGMFQRTPEIFPGNIQDSLANIPIGKTFPGGFPGVIPGDFLKSSLEKFLESCPESSLEQSTKTLPLGCSQY